MNRKFNQQLFENTFNKHKQLLNESMQQDTTDFMINFLSKRLPKWTFEKTDKDGEVKCNIPSYDTLSSYGGFSGKETYNALNKWAVVKGSNPRYYIIDKLRHDSGEHSHSPEMRVRSDEPQFSYMNENYDPDEAERQKYYRDIEIFNKRDKSRYPCPTCNTKDALSAYEKKQGYQCTRCADSEEGMFEASSSMGEPVSGINEATPPNFPADLKNKIIKKYGKSPKAYATMWTLSKKYGKKLDEIVNEKIA